MKVASDILEKRKIGRLNNLIQKKKKSVEDIRPLFIRSVFDCENSINPNIKFKAYQKVLEIISIHEGKFDNLGGDNYEVLFYFDKKEYAEELYDSLKKYRSDGLYLDIIQDKHLYIDWSQYCPNGVLIRVINE